MCTNRNAGINYRLQVCTILLCLYNFAILKKYYTNRKQDFKKIIMYNTNRTNSHAQQIWNLLESLDRNLANRKKLPNACQREELINE